MGLESTSESDIVGDCVGRRMKVKATVKENKWIFECDCLYYFTVGLSLNGYLNSDSKSKCEKEQR